ncbi:MAG TPA: 5-bromo-4-chloroindolyl phosphate hydrolysis family protein [Lachnospiraceae bacterium]|nr:5-bromo-4-chloroindolyl phosphate hydrolysis family protein [Lachnospiraceae bacterium]
MNPNNTRNNSHGMNPNNTKQRDLFPNVPVGKLSGRALTVLGSIGILTFGIGAFILSLMDHVFGNLDFFGVIALGLIPFFLGSTYMLGKGTRIRKRLQRFHRYLSVLRGRGYYTLKELSANTGYSKRYLLKDLRKMISIGMFPEGHIDEQETCLILNRESYQQYQELQKNLRSQSAQEQSGQATNGVNTAGTKSSDTTRQGGETSMSPELKKAIEAGQFYINQIREGNDAIPGEEVSNKLYRLEEVIRKIFQYVELHPTQLSEIQKFMDYYLPTTLKLVNAYKEFDSQPIQGDNIMTAKKEIEDTLDTINTAFENLLDSLFEDAAMDVSTDISVLQAMLAQEGLTQDDFAKMRKMGGQNNE